MLGSFIVRHRDKTNKAKHTASPYGGGFYFCLKVIFMDKLNLTENFEKTANEYLSLGFSVIPAGQDKKPLVAWATYQKELPTNVIANEWASQFGNPNIGIVTGKISNLIVVDFDPRHGADLNAFSDIKTPTVKTGGGGKHLYFQYEDGIQTKAGLKPGYDIRSEGGYVVAPDSLHNSGNKYEWLIHPKGCPPIQMPDELKQFLFGEASKQQKTSDVKKVLSGVSEGNRNESAAKIAGKILKMFTQNEWDTEGWKFFLSWNQQNNPPLEESELLAVFESIKKRELAKPQQDDSSSKRKVADLLMDLCTERGVITGLDQQGSPIAIVPNEPNVAYSIRGEFFKRWLHAAYWEETAKGFSNEQFSTFAGSIEGRAYSQKNKIFLHNRIARIGKKLYYDLGDGINVVEINPDGYGLITNSPVKFRRYRHQKIQVMPLAGGSLTKISPFVNLKDKYDIVLLLTYIVAVFIPDIPRGVIVCHGAQGSAKSTVLKVIRALVDPSSTPIIISPKDIGELVQISNHHYCVYLDNLSYLSEDLSDALSGLVTETGLSKRKLFTDEDDIMFYQKNAIGITGITIVPSKADLLDRSIIITLERIPEDKRRGELEFWADFEKQKPYLLGAVFSALSKVLSIVDTIEIKNKPRLADYAQFAAAASIALGGSVEGFLVAYRENIKRQNQTALESSPVAQTIIRFMENKDAWEGTSSTLFNELNEIAENMHFSTNKYDGFPKSPNWLWKKVMQVKPNLEAIGIYPARRESTTGTIITLIKNKVTPASDNTATTPTLPSTSQNPGGMAPMAVNFPDKGSLFSSLEHLESKKRENLKNASVEELTSLKKELKEWLISHEVKEGSDNKLTVADAPFDKEKYVERLRDLELTEEELATRKISEDDEETKRKKLYEWAGKTFDGTVDMSPVEEAGDNA